MVREPEGCSRDEERGDGRVKHNIRHVERAPASKDTTHKVCPLY